MSTWQPPRQMPDAGRRLGNPSRSWLSRTVPVETADFLDARHQPGHIHSEPVQRHDGDGVAHELQVFRRMWSASWNARSRSVQTYSCPISWASKACSSSASTRVSAASEMRMTARACRPTAACGTAITLICTPSRGRWPKHVDKSCKLLPRSGVQIGDLTFLWKGAQDACFVFGRHRRRPGGLQKLGEGAGVHCQQVVRVG